MNRIFFVFALLVACAANAMPSSDGFPLEKKNTYGNQQIQQMRSITGKVVDEKGEPVIGANVLERETNNGVITDIEGRFSLQVSQGAVLIVSYVGYLRQEIVTGDNTVLNITLREDTQNLEEVVVVGYGTQKKTSLTASVSAINGETIVQQPVGDITNTLGGRMSGIIFTQGNGEPGADRANILIRGIGTTGGTSPLIIVDGIPRDFSRLDPNTIESITILKDAAAVASYGMAGANGVILVTTKKGEKGTASFSYNGFYGWQNPTVLTKFADSYQYATLFNMANDNMGQPHRYSESDLQKFKDGSDPVTHPNHNVLKELITPNSPLTSHNIQLSGGNENVDYYVSLNYLYQGGMWKPTDMNKYTLMSKINMKATRTTNVELSITGRIEQFKQAGVPSGGGDQIFYQAFRTPPVAPVTYPNGLPGVYEGRSVYGQIFLSGSNEQRYYVLYNQMTIEQEIPFVKGLTLKGVVAYDLRPTRTKLWKTPMPYYTVDTSQEPYVYTLAGYDGPEKPSLSQVYYEDQSLNLQGHINYKRTFGKHDVSGLVVFEAWDTEYVRLGAVRRNYNVNIPEINTGSSDPADLSNEGSSSETKQRSIIYRLNYAFDDKYLIETAGRYDGSYYFAPNHRFGFFPSVSLGWRMTEESFLKDKTGWLNNLKLRFSYGESGALASSPFQYLTSYGLYGNATVLNGAPTQGIYERSEPNLDITWEKAKKLDVGIDLGLFNNKLTVSADVFSERRSNMLVSPQVTVPFEYGVGIAQENKGRMANKGFEFSVGAFHDFSRDLHADIQLNFTYAENKIVEIFETAATYDNPNRRQTGRPLSTKFGYKALGLFQLSDDLNGDGVIDENEYEVRQPWGAVHPGDIKYQDTNGDGSITVDDQVPIGNSDIPRIIYGLSPSVRYRDFDLNLLLQGAAMRDFYMDGTAVFPFENMGSVPITALDVWTPDNPNAGNPRVTPQPVQNNRQYSSWWLQDAGYLRLKTVEIGYTIPQAVLSKAKLSAVRIYLSGQNMLTWSKLENFDPEMSQSNGWYYPQQRVTSVGVNIHF
ncbi:MAG: TonB-dependent receptor [Tannerella sp.]|jgi:TonB-linked SusC/RagA family outer membrane protein|nr:TonB-dependent receptor [Tannerella sp.]